MENVLKWLVFADFLLIICLLAFISWQDIILRVISNSNLIVLLFLVVPYQVMQFKHPNIVAALAIIVAFFPLFICNVIGGGDIKFMSVLSLSQSGQQLIDFFFVTAFLGGAIGVFGLVFFRKSTRLRGIPYGVAISLSYFITNI